MSEMPNLLLMLFFPLICLALGAMMDFSLAFLRRRKTDSFPGGANRFYWAVMIASLVRSAVFSLFFVPALALEGAIVTAYHMSQFELSVAMVLPALFGAYFATRLERHVFELLESALLRDRAQFLAATSRPKVGA
jgi:hypothetical protein